jgi:hypothetical protein
VASIWITDAIRMPLNDEWTKAEDGWALGEEDVVYEIGI